MSDEFNAFKARFEAQGEDPEQVVKLLVEGMLKLEQDQELGSQMMALVISTRMLQPAADAMSGHRFTRASSENVSRLVKNPNIARSYAGATHQDGYKGADPSRISLDRGYSPRTQGVGYPKEGQAKFFVSCGGADRPRPVSLARNNAGVWKVREFSSLTTGVKKPASEAGDF